MILFYSLVFAELELGFALTILIGIVPVGIIILILSLVFLIRFLSFFSKLRVNLENGNEIISKLRNKLKLSLIFFSVGLFFILLGFILLWLWITVVIEPIAPWHNILTYTGLALLLVSLIPYIAFRDLFYSLIHSNEISSFSNIQG